MSEPKFWAYRVRGKPLLIREQVMRFVMQHRLRERIPRICHERISSGHGKPEFYFFLELAEDDDTTPPEILNDPGLTSILGNIAFQEPFNHDQIKTMVGPEVESIEYARHIHSYSLKPSSPQNPFDFAASEPIHLGEQRQEAYNHLLYWMSAKGTATWQVFREACTTLGLDADSEARQVFRRLRLLGHAEYLDHGTRWTICPPCLVESQTTQGTVCFLAGARVPSLIQRLEEAPFVDCIQSLLNGGAPDTVLVHLAPPLSPTEVFGALSGWPLSFVGQVGSRLLSLLPTIGGWQREVLNSIPVPAERYVIHRWSGSGFDEWVARPENTGFYRLEDMNAGPRSVTLYLFFDAETNRWLEGDWYGLRFLANWHLRCCAGVRYEDLSQRLYVPDVYHFPDLYERALVLSSGRLPQHSDSGLTYEEIDRSFAETLVAKLGAALNTGS